MIFRFQSMTRTTFKNHHLKVHSTPQPLGNFKYKAFSLDNWFLRCAGQDWRGLGNRNNTRRQPGALRHQPVQTAASVKVIITQEQRANHPGANIAKANCSVSMLNTKTSKYNNTLQPGALRHQPVQGTASVKVIIIQEQRANRANKASAINLAAIP